MTVQTETKLFDVLMVEDNPGDVRLTMEAMKDAKIALNMHVVGDGIEALEFLRRQGKYADKPFPDLILLDLNLPRMDGRELLVELKKDEKLKRTPVVVVTTSKADEDILKSYELNANCYITKPLDIDQFIVMVKTIEQFWFTIAKLPSERKDFIR